MPFLEGFLECPLSQEHTWQCLNCQTHSPSLATEWVGQGLQRQRLKLVLTNCGRWRYGINCAPSFNRSVSRMLLYISNLKGLEGISCDTCPVNLIHESHFLGHSVVVSHLPARASAAGCHPYRPWQSPKKRHCNRSRREVRPGSEPVWCRVTCSFIFHEI